MRFLLYLLAIYMMFPILTLPGINAAELLIRTQILMGTVPVTLLLDPGKDTQADALAAMSQTFQQARRLEASVDSDPLLHKRATQLTHRTLGYFDTQFGMGGIAKGYIVDQMAQLLRALAYNHFLINAGGDIWAENRLDKQAWEIEINSLPDRLCLRQGAIASSGTSERGHHIFDPSTGKPTLNTDRSVTVLARTTEAADALSTAVFAAGSDKSRLIAHLLQEDPQLHFISIHADGQVDIKGNLNIECNPK